MATLERVGAPGEGSEVIRVKVQDLRAGDRIITANGSARVMAINEDRELTTVHNFAVEENHTYFVGETHSWVHTRAPSVMGGTI